VWCWYEGKEIYQWNAIKHPELNPCTYGQMIFNKGDKPVQWENLPNK
jgi:hypothetical protein